MAVKTAGSRNLQRQLDEAFPDRHTPDGWIADSRHGISGHQPDDVPGSQATWNGDPDNVAEVRALDVSADLGAGVDSRRLVAHLVSLPKLATVIRFVIHRGRIYHARDGFAGEAYGGDNPHNEHIHVEFAWTQAADNNTSFDYHLEEVPVALTAADKTWMAEQIRDAVREVLVDDPVVARTLRARPWQYIGGGIPEGMSTLGVLNKTHEAVTADPA